MSARSTTFLVLAALVTIGMHADGFAQERGRGGPPGRRGGGPPPQRATEPLPAAAEKIAWFGTWEGGLAEAERTGRPIMLVAAAPQCHEAPGIW